MSAAGTARDTCAPIMMGAEPARNLAIPRTTGMPHRPSSSDGHTSIFIFSNPAGRRYRLSKCARRYAASASLSEASVRLPPKDGAAWILPNPKFHSLPLGILTAPGTRESYRTC